MEDIRRPLWDLSPSGDNTDVFSLTPLQFGISTQSFIPTSGMKDKSRVAQLKARRRSSVGVRGSPETNSLIRFRAKRALKTPPPSPQGSLLSLRCNSLKTKMAAFQLILEEEESGESEERLNKENEFNKIHGPENPAPSPRLSSSSPSKKRRLAPREECEGKITVTGSTSHQQDEAPHPPPAVESDAKNELLSSPMLCRPDHRPAEIPSGLKKRVRFGAPLMPEFFDKDLPPSTPLQKGGTPRRGTSSVGRHSLLKTPLPQSNGASPVQPDRSYTDHELVAIQKICFSDAAEETHTRAEEPEAEGLQQLPEEEEQPAVPEEEEQPAVPEEEEQPAVPEEEEQPAVPEEEEEPTVGEEEEEPRVSRAEGLQQLPEEEEEPAVREEEEEPARPLTRSGVKAELKSTSPVKPEPRQTRGRKRTLLVEAEPVRRSTRSATASASGKIKRSSAVKQRFGHREVDRSLYGKRDYASKNPLLSPIVEATPISAAHTPGASPLSALRPGTEGEQGADGEQVTQTRSRTPPVDDSGSFSPEAPRVKHQQQRSGLVHQEDGTSGLDPESRRPLQTHRPEQEAEQDLAPWQRPDFNIEDVLKPVGGSRRSVRRSLRNRRSLDPVGAGLAWVEQTSPDPSRTSRRRTRTSRTSEAPPETF